MVVGNWHLWHKLPSAQELMLNVSLLFNLIPGRSAGIVWASWTIGVEILFYLMFPLLIKVASAPVRLGVCSIGTLALAILVHHGVTHSHLSAATKSEVLTMSLALHLPVFVLGIVAYRIFTSRAFRKVRRGQGAILVAAALIYYFSLAYNRMDLSSVGIGWSAPAWILLVLGLAINPVRPIVNVLTRFYGRISYSVYLNHPIVVALLKPIYLEIYRHVPGPGLALVASAVVTFLVLTPWAYVTYRLVEQPGIRFGSRLIRSLDRVPQHRIVLAV
jgi:peptidoglycan/LPS O-acetylase OafA/YrhL